MEWNFLVEFESQLRSKNLQKATLLKQLPSKKFKNPYITIIHLNILPWEYETPSNKSATPIPRFILKKWSPNVVCCCISFGHSFLNCYSNLKLDVFNTLKGLQFCYLTLTVFPWASCMFLASSKYYLSTILNSFQNNIIRGEDWSTKRLLPSLHSLISHVREGFRWKERKISEQEIVLIWL